MAMRAASSSPCLSTTLLKSLSESVKPRCLATADMILSSRTSISMADLIGQDKNIFVSIQTILVCQGRGEFLNTATLYLKVSSSDLKTLGWP